MNGLMEYVRTILLMIVVGFFVITFWNWMIFEDEKNQKLVATQTIISNNYIILAKRVHDGYRSSSNIVALVDFSVPITQKRLFIIDVELNKIIFSTYTSHGSGSGRGKVPNYFSNTPGSHTSSLGVYRTTDYYIGDNGFSLKIKGLNDTNSNAEKRLIVIHGADYIGNGKEGKSWGCFAVPRQDLNTVLKLLGKGSLLYAFK